jgi:hypothetical protein
MRGDRGVSRKSPCARNAKPVENCAPKRGRLAINSRILRLPPHCKKVARRQELRVSAREGRLTLDSPSSAEGLWCSSPNLERCNRMGEGADPAAGPHSRPEIEMAKGPASKGPEGSIRIDVRVQDPILAHMHICRRPSKLHGMPCTFRGQGGPSLLVSRTNSRHCWHAALGILQRHLSVVSCSHHALSGSPSCCTPPILKYTCPPGGRAACSSSQRLTSELGTCLCRPAGWPPAAGRSAHAS